MRHRTIMLRVVVTGALACALVACGPNLTRPPRNGWDGGVTPPLDCVPNLDGRIDSSELEAVTGVPVSFLINPAGSTRDVDLVGTQDGDVRVWDLGTDYASDAMISLAAQPIAGQWFETSFPTAEFVTAIDPAGTTLGVYRHDERALELLGVASAEESPPEGQTLLVYETPIAVFLFPLEPGAHWVSAGEVRGGTVRGLPYAGRDTYEVTVAGEGTLVLTDLSFERALRVQTTVTLAPAAGATITRRQSSFLFECFGEVARATSTDGETSDDFTTAAELRRFGL